LRLFQTGNLPTYALLFAAGVAWCCGLCGEMTDDDIDLYLCLPLLAALVLALVPAYFAVIMRAPVGGAFVTMLAAIHMFCSFTELRRMPAVISSSPPSRAGRGIPRMACKLGVDGLNVGAGPDGCDRGVRSGCCSYEIRPRKGSFYILLLVMTGGYSWARSASTCSSSTSSHETGAPPWCRRFIMIGCGVRGERKNYATFQITLYQHRRAAGAGRFDRALLQVPADIRHVRTSRRWTKIFHGPLDGKGAQNFHLPAACCSGWHPGLLWPFHSWAPLGYGSAPSATAMLHAGVLKKFGLTVSSAWRCRSCPQAAQSWMYIVAWLCLGKFCMSAG